jgi:RNA polymerase sigma factor (sigma-70 family)
MIRRLYNTDDEIIQGILKNQDVAVSILYKTHFPLIRTFVLNNSGSEQDAKDIYQESFIILIDNIKKGVFKAESKLKTYLYSICRRQWLKELSNRNKFVFNLHDYEEFIDFPKITEEQMDQYEERFNAVHQSLQDLGEPCTTIISDFYLKQMSMKEITIKLGYTNSDNAKNQKYKCMQRLKRLFFGKYLEEKG